MIHDPDILDYLSGITPQSFAGEVFRATRKNLDPLTPSLSGGRWSVKGETAALDTSLERDGALAEITFHWSQLTPMPTKPALIHRLGVTTKQTLRLLRADLGSLGVEMSHYEDVLYGQTARIGAAVAFLDCDGLIVPCARWSCENLVLFNDSLHPDGALTVIATEEVDWRAWGTNAQKPPAAPQPR